MIRGFSRRGQPLIVLAMLLGGWVSARAMIWDSASGDGEMTAPFATLQPAAMVTTAAQLRKDAAQAERSSDRSLGNSGSTLSIAQTASDAYALRPISLAPALTHLKIDRPLPTPSMLPRALKRLATPLPTPTYKPTSAGLAGSHHLMWMAALAQLPMPAGQSSMRLASSQPIGGMGGLRAASARDSGQQAERWSVDSWVHWRRGSAQLAGAILTPSYGASQAGMVLRYRLAPASNRRATAYLRTTTALNGSNERDAALGLSARPFGKLPLVLAGEARFTQFPGGSLLRPAAFVVTELPAFALPLGLRGEAYGQAGYIGGRFATGFADGQMRVDRRLLGVSKGELRLGAGVWGGAQKGASRLDAGPTLSLGQPLGGASSVRLNADWRFRVAGKAAPGSGPAITLSAGF